MPFELDSWNLPSGIADQITFVNNFFVIGLAYVLRRAGVIRDTHVDGLHMVTFSLCLPCFMLGIMWTAKIEPGLLIIAPISVAVQLCCIAMVSVGVRCLPQQFRGLGAMATTANSLSYVMPVILTAKQFGSNYIPSVLVWELGGNIWVSNIYYGIMATTHSPNFEAEATSESACVDNCHRVSDPETLGASVHAGEPSGAQEAPGSPSKRKFSVPAVVAVQVLPVVRQLAKTPMLWGTLTGLVLNLIGLPLYPIPGQAIKILAVAFPSLLYTLVGTALRFNISAKSYDIVLKILAARWLLHGSVAAVLNRLPILDPATRSVISLCMFGPIATPFLNFAYRLGHDMEVASLLYNVSALTSIAALNFLVLVL